MSSGRICIAFLLVLSLDAAAQKGRVGIKAGANLATMTFALPGQSTTTDNLVSYHAGFYATMMSSKKFGVQPELLYSVMGGTRAGKEIRMGYLAIPLIFRYQVFSIVSIQAGPQLSILLSATDSGADAMSQYSAMDFGLNAGLGVDITKRLHASLRYYAGLSNITTLDLASVTNTPGYDLVVKNHAWQVSVGYTLSRR